MEQKTKSNLDSIVYIDISKEILEKHSHHNTLLELEENVPLPVQLPDGVKKIEDFSPSMLTIEVILAGMLVVFANDRQNMHIAYYRKVFASLRPNIKEELFSTVAIKINNEDYAMAEDLLHSLIGFDEVDLNARLMLAYLYEKMSKEKPSYRDLARGVYDDLICSEPPFPPVFFNAAIFFMEEENYQKAKDLLETYIVLKIDDEEEEEVRKVEKAQNVLNHLNSQVMSDEAFQQAYSDIKNGKLEKALPHIHFFIEKHPLVWNGWFLLGWALRCQKRWGEGEKALKKCLELYKKTIATAQLGKNEHSNICNELSLCLIEEGKVDEACLLLEEALAKDCENITLIANLGLISLKKGDRLKAISYFRTALYIDPNDEISKTMLADIE